MRVVEIGRYSVLYPEAVGCSLLSELCLSVQGKLLAAFPGHLEKSLNSI